MAFFIKDKTMKRSHRKAHKVIWSLLPIALFGILWVAFSIHGSQL